MAKDAHNISIIMDGASRFPCTDGNDGERERKRETGREGTIFIKKKKSI